MHHHHAHHIHNNNDDNRRPSSSPPPSPARKRPSSRPGERAGPSPALASAAAWATSEVGKTLCLCVVMMCRHDVDPSIRPLSPYKTLSSISNPPTTHPTHTPKKTTTQASTRSTTWPSPPPRARWTSSSSRPPRVGAPVSSTYASTTWGGACVHACVAVGRLIDLGVGWIMGCVDS